MKNYFLISLFLFFLVACKSDYIADYPINGNDLIRVNQIGYLPDSPKKFTIVGYEGDSFKIKNQAKEVVLQGALASKGVWDASKEDVFMGDFSEFKIPGIYRISVRGLGTSWPFEIRKDIYNEVAKASVRSFYLQRVSLDLPEKYAGVYNRQGGHPDTVCYYHPSTGNEGSMSSPGGWYDAGDYGKYIVNAGVTVGALLNLAEIKPNVFGDNSLNIPESGNGLDDYLDEIKYELDWMLTMQDDDGGVFHKLTTKNFEDFVMPVEAINDKYVIGKSTAATLDFAATMAMTSRVYKKYDEDFAGKCLMVATKAWNWAIENPEEFYAGNPEDIATGAYNDIVLEEEFFWAASELFVATGEDIYMNEIQEKLDGITFRVTESWRNYVDNLGYYSLLTEKSPLSEEGKNAVMNGLIDLADSLGQVVEMHPYRIPLHHFVWGSNSDLLNLATIFIVTYHYTNDLKYRNYALETMDYIFGKNATGYSFITGFGGKTPMYIHHRQSDADGIKNPFPGFVAGGPNADRQDRRSLSESGFSYISEEPARSYIDKTPSFASNEICLNWNAPFTFMVGYLYYIED